MMLLLLWLWLWLLWLLWLWLWLWLWLLWLWLLWLWLWLWLWLLLLLLLLLLFLLLLVVVITVVDDVDDEDDDNPYDPVWSSTESMWSSSQNSPLRPPGGLLFCPQEPACWVSGCRKTSCSFLYFLFGRGNFCLDCMEIWIAWHEVITHSHPLPPIIVHYCGTNSRIKGDRRWRMPRLGNTSKTRSYQWIRDIYQIDPREAVPEVSKSKGYINQEKMCL